MRQLCVHIMHAFFLIKSCYENMLIQFYNPYATIRVRRFLRNSIANLQLIVVVVGFILCIPFRVFTYIPPKHQFPFSNFQSYYTSN